MAEEILLNACPECGRPVEPACSGEGYSLPERLICYHERPGLDGTHSPEMLPLSRVIELLTNHIGYHKEEMEVSGQALVMVTRLPYPFGSEEVIRLPRDEAALFRIFGKYSHEVFVYLNGNLVQNVVEVDCKEHWVTTVDSETHKRKTEHGIVRIMNEKDKESI